MQKKPGSTVLLNAKRIVVKVGSSLVTDEGRGLDAEAIGQWCGQLAVLDTAGTTKVGVIAPTVVSSPTR